MIDNDLYSGEFRIIKQKLGIREDYLNILNTLIKVRKDKKITLDLLAQAFRVSKATISLFENQKKIDYELLFKYSAFLDYEMKIELRKLTYSEIRNK